jgi:hypothetical protein
MGLAVTTIQTTRGGECFIQRWTKQKSTAESPAAYGFHLFRHSVGSQMQEVTGRPKANAELSWAQRNWDHE